jgi:hypothetical protein
MGYIDTYDSAVEAAADRTQQKELLTALNGWDRALRRDECGAWTIIGKQGSIHTWGDGKSWVSFVACRSALHWTYTKRRLSFCTVTQDCEDEGSLRLHQLPTPEQAEIIRDVLGIRKRAVLSPEELERRRTLVARARSAQGRRNGTGPPACPGENADFRRGACQMIVGSDGHGLRSLRRSVRQHPSIPRLTGHWKHRNPAGQMFMIRKSVEALLEKG